VKCRRSAGWLDDMVSTLVGMASSRMSRWLTASYYYRYRLSVGPHGHGSVYQHVEGEFSRVASDTTACFHKPAEAPS